MAARNKPAGQTKEERDRISRGRIESFIDDLATKHLQCPTCKSKMDFNDLKDVPPSVASLIKARYDKLAPSLQAVEQTVIDPRDKADPGDLERQLLRISDEAWERVSLLRTNARKSLENSGSVSPTLQ